MTFLIDMPLSPELGIWLESMGHDAVHAVELGLGQAPDTEILEAASNDGRVVVHAELPRSIVVVDRQKIRRRNLPIDRAQPH